MDSTVLRGRIEAKPYNVPGITGAPALTPHEATGETTMMDLTTFTRGDAIEYSGPFVNMRGRGTFLTACEDGRAVLQVNDAIEAVSVRPSFFGKAA